MKSIGLSEELNREFNINDLYFKEMEYPKNKTISGLFREVALNNPDNTALMFGGQKMSYGELNAKTDALAIKLRDMGVCRDMIVAILCGQSIELVIGMISILKASGAFLVIDPNYPKERINFILEDSKTEIMLSKSSYLQGVEFKKQILNFDEYDINGKVDKDIENINESYDLAFIVYTSGTTGIPKAAMIEHRNSINASYFLKSVISADSKTKIMQFFNPSFSVSYQEVFVTLLSGGTLYIIDESLKQNIGKMLEFVSKEGINTLFLPSSILKLIMNDEKYHQKMPNTINQIITAGEQMIITREFMNCLNDKGIKCYNNYGTSETNIATLFNINNADNFDNFLPIGEPVANTHIYILDENLKLQPIGEEGEIYISGDGVGRGYLNNPGLTNEKFLSNPFIKGTIMYKTGDLGKRLIDGNIRLLGRTDYQVKVRGFRIELEEIEYNLLKHPLVKEAVVIAKSGNIDGTFLYAYIVTDRPVKSEDIRDFLSSRIPDYMMPSYIIRLTELPKTSAGKIDRKSLTENRTVLLNEDEGSADTDCSAESAVILNEIKIMLESIIGSKLVNIRMDDEFTKLGLDSISFIKLVADVENKFGFDFDDEKLNNQGCRYIKELVSYVEEKVR